MAKTRPNNNDIANLDFEAKQWAAADALRNNMDAAEYKHVERMGENDKIVTRCMADQEFQGSAFPILAREIFEAVRAKVQTATDGGHESAPQG